MPKVTRKDTSGPLQEAVGMVVDDEQLPVKPNFSALSAQEQAGGKVEFRRVRTASCCMLHALHVILHSSLCCMSVQWHAAAPTAAVMPARNISATCDTPAAVMLGLQAKHHTRPASCCCMLPHHMSVYMLHAYMRVPACTNSSSDAGMQLLQAAHARLAGQALLPHNLYSCQL